MIPSELYAYNCPHLILNEITEHGAYSLTDCAMGYFDKDSKCVGCKLNNWHTNTTSQEEMLRELEKLGF